MPSRPGRTNADRMKPACATLEYASMRFTSVCAIASTLPTTIETAESAATAGRRSHCRATNATSSTRTSPTKTATLVAADMNAVTGLGAPW